MLKKYEKASEQVSIKGMLKAREAISHYIRPTNLTHYSELSRLLGCDAFVKHENHMPTGSFKIRGALNFFHSIPKDRVENGVLVSTRGNHGLAMAWAARWFGVPCTVVVPENNNPETNRIIESFGAELIVHGKDFYEAQFFCDELVASAGYYYVEQGNEPDILNGIGPMGLGGATTLLGARIVSAGRHPACYFVTVSYSCWVTRRASAELDREGRIVRWL